MKPSPSEWKEKLFSLLLPERVAVFRQIKAVSMVGHVGSSWAPESCMTCRHLQVNSAALHHDLNFCSPAFVNCFTPPWRKLILYRLQAGPYLIFRKWAGHMWILRMWVGRRWTKNDSCRALTGACTSVPRLVQRDLGGLVCVGTAFFFYFVPGPKFGHKAKFVCSNR